jgi:hypothetical protein
VKNSTPDLDENLTLIIYGLILVLHKPGPARGTSPFLLLSTNLVQVQVKPHPQLSSSLFPLSYFCTKYLHLSSKFTAHDPVTVLGSILIQEILTTQFSIKQRHFQWHTSLLQFFQNSLSLGFSPFSSRNSVPLFFSLVHLFLCEL